MALLQLDSLLTRFGTPVAVADRTGQLLLANAAGRVRFQQLPQALASLATLDGSPLTLAHFLDSLSPVSVEAGDQVIRLAPIRPDEFPDRLPEGGILLEWHPISTGEELDILREVSEAVNSSLILEDIFESLGDVLHRYIPYREVSIVILDDSQNGIKILVRILEDGTLEITGENNAFAGYDAVVDTLLRNPVPVVYGNNDLPDSVVFLPETASAIVVPLINKGVVIGLIAMASGYGNLFQPYHQKLLRQVSDQVAVAVENAKLYWQTQAQAGREFLINQLTKAIRQTLDIEEILGTAAQELGKVTGVSRCFIQYFPEEGGLQIYDYILPGVAPVPLDELTTLGLERRIYDTRLQSVAERLSDESRREEVLQEAFNPFVLNDIRDCPPFLSGELFFEQHRIRSLAVFPILIRDRMVGTITLHQCDAYRVWIVEDIELLKAIAEHLGVALHQAKLFMELEQQKNTLEQTLEELKQAQIYLIQSEKMAMLGQFVAGIAHEVNTPLGTITSNNDTMRSCVEKLKKEGPGDSKWLKTIENLLGINRMASDRIQEIVRNLRNFARLDESELKTVNLEENIDSTLLLLKNNLQKARIRVEKDFPEDMPPVECFPGLLNQVFMNMLVNAMHAIGEQSAGGKTGGLIRIEVSGVADTGVISVTIRDNGKGIAEKHLARIFDPGFTTKGVGVGTGLGLALCFKIVEKHQGRIDVESRVGEGTAMKVTIPVSQRKK